MYSEPDFIVRFLKWFHRKFDEFKAERLYERCEWCKAEFNEPRPRDRFCDRDCYDDWLEVWAI